MEEIGDVLGLYDRVGDGKLAVSDIYSALRALDMNPGSSDWDEVLLDYKDRKVERIDINEFAGIYAEESQRKAATHKELATGLKSLDSASGESGLCNRATLMRFLTLAGDKISEKDAEYLISSCLEKGGKNVNIDEIVKLVMNPIDQS